MGPVWFWPCQVHQDATVCTNLLCSALEVANHRSPRLGIVIGTVNPHTIHPTRQQFPHQPIVASRFARHRHHDVHSPACRRWPEQRLGICIKQRFAFVKTDCGLDRRRPVPLAAFEPMGHYEHRVYTGQDMGFASAEGRQTKRSQTFLQRANIALTQGQIV